MVNVTQGAFSGGMLSEGMYSRRDTTKQKQGLKDARNIIIKTQGGVENRAGTLTASGFDTSGAAAAQFLIPFAFNTEQTYKLEFTDNVFRVLKDGAYVLDTNVGPLPLTSVSAANPSEFTMDSSATAAKLAVGDLVFLKDPNGTHKLHETTFQVSAVSAAVVSYTVYDGTTLDTTTGSWGTLGSGATLEKIYQQSHPYSLVDVPSVRFAQDADTMYMAHRLYAPIKIARSAHDVWTVTMVVFVPAITQVTEASKTLTGVTQANPAVFTSTGHAFRVGDTVGITGVAGMTELNDKIYVVDSATANTFTVVERSGAVYTDSATGRVILSDLGASALAGTAVITGTPLDSTAFTAYTSGGTLASPAAEAVLGTGVGTLKSYKYMIAPVNVDEDEGLPTHYVEVMNDLTFDGSINYIGFKSHDDAARYNVYREDAGAYGFIGSTGSSMLADENITPDTARGPRIDRNPFSAAGDYPSIVTFYEQRLAWASTVNDPQLVEMSRTASVENFTTSYPSVADDAFRFRIRAKEVNRIRAFLPHVSFAIMTSGGEWEIAAQGTGTYVRPDKRALVPVSNYGSSDIEPVVVGDIALFVTPAGDVIRDFRLNTRTEPSGELTVLARDLFDNKQITSWAYAQAPDGVLWVTLDDGSLATMTYVPEHDVWAWSYQVIGGIGTFVHQVASTREGTRDTPYFVVSRTLNGSTVTMVEKLAKREDVDVKTAYYLDGGLLVDAGSAVSELSGLLHLRGESVVALVDGDVVENLTVDSTGTVSFGVAEGQYLSVGFAYTARIETLPLNIGVYRQGDSLGKPLSTSRINIELSRSRGVQVGAGDIAGVPLSEWDGSLVGGPLPLLSGLYQYDVASDWVRHATMFAEQPHPLPMTITGVSPEWEVSS